MINTNRLSENEDINKLFELQQEENKRKKIYEQKKKQKNIFIISILSIILILIAIFLFLFFMKPTIKNIELANYFYEEDSVTIKINTSAFFGNTECYISSHETTEFADKEHVISKNNICTFNTKLKDYYIYLKKTNQSEFAVYKLSDYYKKTIDIITGVDKIYLGVSEEETINARVITFNETEDMPQWKVDDESIVSLNDGLIKGLKTGETTIHITASDGYTKDVKIIVTDLISSPIINNTRAFLECKKYDNSSAELLDNILKTKIENAGYKTRAGVVEAARFLTLRLPYRINYFIETGRLNNYGTIDYVDGEGRFYHSGLYLSEVKYKTIKASQNGPAIWGCPLKQDNGQIRENGFDCSGFVTWTLLNGGFDVKDTGAGFTDRSDDVSDLGEFNSISLELLKSGKVKAGDLIGANGHAAIIAGIDNEHIYIAEALVHNVGVTLLTYTYEELAESTKFTYISLMDSVYKKDGNYKNMW